MVKLSRESSKLKKMQSKPKNNSVKPHFLDYNDLSDKVKSFIPKRAEILKDKELAAKFGDILFEVRVNNIKSNYPKNLDGHKQMMEDAIKEKFGDIDPQMQDYIDAYFEYGKQFTDKIKKYGFIIAIIFVLSPFLLFLLPILIPIAIFYSKKK